MIHSFIQCRPGVGIINAVVNLSLLKEK